MESTQPEMAEEKTASSPLYSAEEAEAEARARSQAKAGQQQEDRSEGHPAKMEVEVDSEERQRQEEAAKLREEGNSLYKAKQFEKALELYDRSWKLDNTTNISALTNKAAVYFEQENFAECIKVCEEAVERGRELRADFKIIAKYVSTNLCR